MLLAFSFALSDVVLVAVVVLFVLIGMAKGFTGSLISFLGTIVSLIIAFLLCGKFAVFMGNHTGIDEWSTGLFKNWLPKWGEYMSYPITDAASLNSALKTSIIPNFLCTAISKIVLPMIDSNTLAAGTTLTNILAPLFGYYLLCVISFVILFILGKIVFLIIGGFAKKAISFKPLKMLDRVLGGVLGIVKAALLVYVALLIINIIPFGFMSPVKEDINKSTIVSYLNDTNLIGKLINQVLDYDFVKDRIPQDVESYYTQGIKIVNVGDFSSENPLYL